MPSCWPPQLGELAAAVAAEEAPIFHPNTGQKLSDAPEVHVHAAAAAGLDVPRYCQVCGRRMVVKVSPAGWFDGCSRQGELVTVRIVYYHHRILYVA